VKRFLEKWIIFLKEDLKIADICLSARRSILGTITDETYFSPELISYFKKADSTKPYIISDSEPSQVVAFKKLINALDHSEKTFRAVEGLDISRDRYLLLGIGPEAIKLSYNAINEVYAALQLINNSSADIQRIVGPHLKALLPQIGLATKALGQFAPENPEERVGTVLGEAIEMLPTEQITKDKGLENLGDFIFSLPQEFEKLHKLIAQSSSGVAPLSITSAKDYQADIAKKAHKLNMAFIKLCNKNLAVSVTGMHRYVSIMRQLGDQTTNLFNTAAPLTKEAYLASAKILENMKHEILPDLISELEQAEESLGLKPGILTKPVLNQVNKFYTQIAEQVNFIGSLDKDLDGKERFLMGTALGKTAKAITGIKKVTIGKEIEHFSNLGVMIDDGFVERRQANQINRLSAAKLDVENNNPLEAADTFFEKLDSYYGGSYYTGCLANLSEPDKKLLIAQYKQFQPHFAALHPQIDKMIVEELQKGPRFLRPYISTENQFSKVSKCQASVKSSIIQHQEQARLNAKLVQNTMMQAEQTTHITPNLNESVSPYVPHSIPTGTVADKPVEHYHQQGIIVTNEIRQLELAKQGVEEFFDYISTKYPTSNPAELTEDDKRFLSTAFIKFQSQFLALKDVVIADRKINVRSLNYQIVQSLAASPSTDLLQLFSNLKSLHPQIYSTLTSLLNNSKENKNSYLKLEIAARDREPLVAKGAELEERTLFGQINELKLSKKVEVFFNFKFKAYLENNLSPLVYKQLDFEKVPFLEFHKDSPEVKMYKQLINTLHYLKNGLEQLESIKDYGDSATRFDKSRFIMTTMNALLMNINSSKYYLMEAAANPGLKDIMNEGLELLSPLKNIPVIGDYLKTPQKSSITQKKADVDIIAAWRAQQAVVQLGLTPVKDKAQSTPALAVAPPSPTSEIPTTPATMPPEPAALEKPKETNYVQLIAEQLYQIPVALNKLKEKATPLSPSQEKKIKKITDKKIKNFVDSLSGLSFGAGTAQNVLNAIQEVQVQISEMAKQGRELTMSNLKEIKSVLGAPLIIAADNAEFHLGLRAGAYSKVVNDRFDNFFSTLLVNLPIEEDAEALDLLLSTGTLEKRKAHEVARLAIDEVSPADTRNTIFGSEYEQFNKVFQDCLSIKAVANIAKNNEAIIDILLDMRGDLLQPYKNIQPLLLKLDRQFTPDYISSCDDEVLLNKRVAEILKVQPHILTQSTNSLATLKIFYLSDEDFNDEQNQINFLKCYQQLQPYLNQIDYTYDSSYFLRELQTPEDFKTALEKIIKEESKLNELIQGLEQAKNLKKDLCLERIHYFEQAIKDQESGIGYEKIQGYKEKVFNKYVEDTLKLDLREQFGAVAEDIYQHIKPMLLEKKAIISASGEIKKNLVKETKAILKDNMEVIKNIVFDYHIHTSVKNTLSEELGFYTEIFIKQIAPQFKPPKVEILNNVSHDKIKLNITEGIDRIIPQLINNNKDLKKAYIDLNQTMKKTVDLLASELAKPKGNSCRDEKISLLQKYLIQLKDIQATVTLSSLNDRNQHVKKALESLKTMDALISVYETLELLNPSANKEVSALMGQLANTKLDAVTRLATISNEMQNLKETDASVNSQVINNYIKINKISSNFTIMLTQIKGLIKEEQFNLAHDPENPCRFEKIQLLESLQATLLNKDAIPKGEATLAFLQERSSKITSQLLTLPNYNQMIDLHVKLSAIRKHIDSKQDAPSELKQEKIREITKMQMLLVPDASNKEVLTRLKEVKEYGLSNECQKIVFRSSDFSIVKAFKSFISVIWSNHNEELVSSFKQKLKEMQLDSPAEKTEKPKHCRGG
jgi:hypothetical protein